MTKAKAPIKLVAFDAVRYLDDDPAIAEHVTAMLEAYDPDLLVLALGDVSRAKGVTPVAEDADPGRETRYKALAPGAKPRFETVMNVPLALGGQIYRSAGMKARSILLLRRSTNDRQHKMWRVPCGRQRCGFFLAPR